MYHMGRTNDQASSPADDVYRKIKVVQFCPWFKFSFLLFLGMVLYGNDFETKENKI